MKISEVLNGVYDRAVGWRPASGAIKPVHIANGLFRDLLGERYRIDRVVAFAVPWKKKGDPEPDRNRTWDHLVNDLVDPTFAAFKAPYLKDRFEQLREFVRGLLAADQAVFPDADYTSLTLASRQMISGDRNDRDVGRFMAHLLKGKEGNGALAKVVIDCLKESDKPQDPLSLVVWPLLGQDAIFLAQSNKISPYANKDCETFFARIEEAADQLAQHESQQGNRLATLQRAVLFTCLTLLGHAQALGAKGDMNKRVPLLMVPEVPKGHRLALASEESLSRYYDAFEDWLAEALAQRLETGDPVTYGDKPEHDERLILPAKDKESVIAFLRSIKTADKGDGKEPMNDLLEERLSLYERALVKHTAANWNRVIGDTLAQSYFSEYTSGGPRDFIGGIGRKAGIIYPHFQGNSKDKRIRPSVAILDVLVKACTPVEEPIPLPKFLDLLWERFGIVVGGRTGGSDTDHAELLRQNGIDLSPTDLAANTQALVDQLVQIGLARRYPDNIAYVGSRNV
ncbi:MAG: hypothetical protein HQL41_05085 [Alphaproteobacteria bacterium]|nr:hypothetical protein [Alphaproteobacteria bacterium]